MPPDTIKHLFMNCFSKEKGVPCSTEHPFSHILFTFQSHNLNLHQRPLGKCCHLDC